MHVKPTINILLKSSLLALMLLILICIAQWGYDSISNYYGYCRYGYAEQKGRNGLRFTTMERLNIAINHYLQNQISMDYSEIAKAEQIDRDPWDELEKRFKLIPYSSREEFLKENPDCCERTWGELSPEIDQFLFWGRADGAGDGMFNFKHKVRYTGQDDSRKEIETTNTFIMVFNCGGSRDKFYYGNLGLSSSTNWHK